MRPLSPIRWLARRSAKIGPAQPAGVSPATRAWTRALLVSLAAGIVSAIASLLPATWAWQENFDLYVLFHLRGVRPPPPDVVIVPIDQRVAQVLSVPRDPQTRERCSDVRVGGSPPPTHEALPPGHLTSRWPRCLHARVVQALKRAGASVVALDILFRPATGAGTAQPDAAAPGDAILADAIASSGNVILAQRLEGEHEQPAAIADSLASAAMGVAPFLLSRANSSRSHTFWTVKENEWAVVSLPLLALQLHTLDLYPRLHAALAREAPDQARHLPATVEELRQGRQIEAAALMLRAVFAREPELRGRVSDAFSRPEHADLTPDQRGLLRALIAAYAGEETRYFNLLGPPGTVQAVRYERLFAGQDLPDLRGKVAFVGLAEYGQPEQYEHFPTVWPDVHGIDMSGVELAATAFANLAAENTVRPAGAWWRAGICLALAASVAWVCFVSLSRRALLFVLAIALGYLAGALLAFEQWALWLPISAALGFAVPLALATAFTVQHAQLKHQYANLYRVFGLFLPRNVLERLVHNAERMAWIRESVFGACVATDGERYTSLAEHMSPDELARFLNRYFETLFPPVTSSQGWVSDVVGDSMLAVWAEAQPSAAIRRRACTAALGIQAASEHFNKQSASGRLPTRIGVDFGPLTLSIIGSGGHWEYRPVGVVPANANRLQALNKRLGTRVLVSEAVASGLDEFILRDVGWFLLRGKTSPTRVFELLALREDASVTQLQLCLDFGQAMESFQAGRLDEARARFERLLAHNPSDGPSAYFAGLCQTRTGFAEGIVMDPE